MVLNVECDGLARAGLACADLACADLACADLACAVECTDIQPTPTTMIHSSLSP